MEEMRKDFTEDDEEFSSASEDNDMMYDFERVGLTGLSPVIEGNEDSVSYMTTSLTSNGGFASSKASKLDLSQSFFTEDYNYNNKENI